MKVYVLTAEQRDALLQRLELEKHLKSPFLKDEDREQEKRIREELHRSFLYHVCVALDAIPGQE